MKSYSFFRLYVHFFVLITLSIIIFNKKKLKKIMQMNPMNYARGDSMMSDDES